MAAVTLSNCYGLFVRTGGHIYIIRTVINRTEPLLYF